MSHNDCRRFLEYIKAWAGYRGKRGIRTLILFAIIVLKLHPSSSRHMATHPRSRSSLMANHLRLPILLIREATIFLPISVRLSPFVLKLSFIVKPLLLFLTSFLKQLPVTFSGWLARSKHYLIYFYYSFCFFSPWLPNQFNVGLNDLHSFLVLEIVLVSLLTCIVRWSSSDSFVESNTCFKFVQHIFNEDDQLYVSRSYELKRDCSHLTSDMQRLEKRRRILVAELNGEPVIGYETPIIEPYKPFAPNRELSNDIAQTEDLFCLPEDLFTEIFKKLAFHDFAFCSTVCKRGRSYCLNLKWSLYPPHPWSIHFQGQNIMNHLDDGRYVLERWEIGGRYYYGWVNGWILSIGSEHISIFNLFSRTQRNLPILRRVGYLSKTKSGDWYRYIDKFILFKACHGDNLQFFVVALFGARGFITFTGPQFQDWICIESDDIACCSDVVLFRGRFYALCSRGKLFLCAFDRSNPCVSLVSEKPAGSFRADRYYLVKNVDHLIAVFKDRNWDSGVKRFGTKTFSIYSSDGSSRYWTRISEPDYLKGRAVFISNRNSWTIDPVKLKNCITNSMTTDPAKVGSCRTNSMKTDPAEVESCRTNSIYFVDDYWFSNNRDGHFIGLFDIANGEIEDFEFEMDQYPPNDVSPFSLTYNDGA